MIETPVYSIVGMNYCELINDSVSYRFCKQLCIKRSYCRNGNYTMKRRKKNE